MRFGISIDIFPSNVYWTHLHNNQREIQATCSDQETSPTNPQQQHYRIPNAPKRDNTGNRTQQARPSNTGSTSDQATWTENQ